MEQPWPHKRNKDASIRSISSCFPCQTPQHPWDPKSIFLWALCSPLSQKPTKMPPNPRLPHTYHLRLRLKKTKTCPSNPLTSLTPSSVWSLPSLSYPSLGHMQRDKLKNKSKKSQGRLLPLFKGENQNFEPLSSDSEQRMSGCGQISIDSRQKHTSELTEFPLAHRASSQMNWALSIFRSLLEDDPSKPTMSEGLPKTPQLLKEPWGGLEMLSTITSSLLAYTHPPDISALPQRVRYLVGSKPCSMRLILNFKPSSQEQKTLMTGGSLQTSSGITAPLNKSVTSWMPERTSKQDWQGLEKTLTSLPSILAKPAVQSGWPPFSTLQVFLMAQSQMRGHLRTKKHWPATMTRLRLRATFCLNRG